MKRGPSVLPVLRVLRDPRVLPGLWVLPDLQVLRDPLVKPGPLGLSVPLGL